MYFRDKNPIGSFYFLLNIISSFNSRVYARMLYLLSARCDCDDVCQCVFKSFLTCCGCWLLVLGVFAVCVLEAYKPRYIAKTHSPKPISPFSKPTTDPPPGQYWRNPSPGAHSGNICLHLKGQDVKHLPFSI